MYFVSGGINEMTATIHDYLGKCEIKFDSSATTNMVHRL